MRGRPAIGYASKPGVSRAAAPVAAAVAFGITLAAMAVAQARDPGGRHADSPLKDWFDGLKSGQGPCCSFADGVSVQDVDWDMQEGHYRVRLDGRWIVVPDEAVVRAPNKFGPAVVWPYTGRGGETLIRCFIPGTLS
jgi:hypothetical protein